MKSVVALKNYFGESLNVITVLNVSCFICVAAKSIGRLVAGVNIAWPTIAYAYLHMSRPFPEG